MPASTQPCAERTSGALTDAQIHARIVGAVLDQRLVPGTRLTEDGLGRIFGVSRTRIRQVLIRLASEQLVTLVPNCGASIAQPTADEAREVFGVRRLVEPQLLRDFVARAPLHAVRGLARWIEAEERARVEGDRHTAIRMAGAFHMHLAEHAGNATLARLMRELVARTALSLMSFGPAHVQEPARRGVPMASLQRASAGCACHDHRAVLSAIERRDAAACVRAMDRHLSRLESQLDFTEPKPGVPALSDLLGMDATWTEPRRSNASAPA